MTCPYATLKVTVSNKQLMFVTDSEYAHLGQVGQDLVELAKQIETGQVEKTVDAIKDWIWSSDNRNGHHMNFIDWDIVTSENANRVDGSADEQFHLDITPKGTVIIAYNEYGKKTIRYKVSSFKRIVNEAK